MNQIFRNARRVLALVILPLLSVVPVPAADDAQSDAAPAAPPAAASKQAAVKTDPAKPVAKVNGQTITQGEVDKYIDEFMQGQMKMMARQGRMPSPEQVQQFRASIAKNSTADMVKQTLVDQALKKNEGAVSEAEIDQQIGEFRSFLKKQNRDLDAMLSKEGRTIENVKADMRKQIAMAKLMEKEEGVKPPTEKEIQALYDQYKAQMEVPEQVRASHILIGFEGNPRDPNFKGPSASEKGEKKKKAEDVLARAKKGEDFGKLAAEFSTDPSNKDHGGDLDFFRHGVMTPAFEKAAFSTKPGQLSDPVETEFGYHIIKVTDHSDTRTLGLEDVKYQLGQKLLSDKIREKMPDLMARLQKSADIQLLDGSKMPEPEPAGASAAKKSAPARNE